MEQKITSDKAVRVKLYGQSNDPKSYDLRDFLRRSVVEFEWVELTSNAETERFLEADPMDNARLPVVELPTGERLYDPTIENVAHQLGWISQPKFKEYDLSIYGAGPAGLSAAVYAASEGIRTVLLEREAIGGQAGTSSLIENYMGFPSGISGADLAERARQQAVKFGVDILLLREGVKADFRDSRIHVQMADGKQMVAKANICATGVEYRKLNLPNEDSFLRRGLYYGAGASEAQYCKDEEVYVIGGGNSAGQAVVNFASYARKVVMLIRGAALRDTLSDYLTHRLAEMKNVEIRTNTQVVGLSGDGALEKIRLQDRSDGSETEVLTRKLFVCIGGKPNTEWAKDTAIVRDDQGYLVCGPDLLDEGQCPDCWPLERMPYYLETSVPGSFAAGDIRHGSVKRLAAAVGDGAMCVTFVHRYLEETF